MISLVHVKATKPDSVLCLIILTALYMLFTRATLITLHSINQSIKIFIVAIFILCLFVLSLGCYG